MLMAKRWGNTKGVCVLQLGTGFYGTVAMVWQKVSIKKMTCPDNTQISKYYS